MAASSPALSNNGAESTPSTPPAATTAATTTPVKSPAAFPTVTVQRPGPPKNLRGLNKPKCIKCGNVARSRCPFQSCKSCCSKAENPCQIHVLKQNATPADKGASANLSTPQQQPSEAPPSGSSAKVSSLRQLSSPFAQFNNVHIPHRSRKPVTRKEALAINDWRFAKLKEYKERNIEAENESFDRYMQNTGLLEEIFDVNPGGLDKDSCSVSNPPTISDDEKEAISEMKVKLRSNPMRIDKFRKRIQQTIDEGLRKVQKHDSSNDGVNNLNDKAILDLARKTSKDWWAGKKTDAFAEINDLLNKARNKEDLKLCIGMRSKIRSQQKITSPEKKTEGAEISEEEGASNDLASGKEPEFSPMKMVRNVEIDQGVLSGMDSHFSSLEEIEDL